MRQDTTLVTTASFPFPGQADATPAFCPPQSNPCPVHAPRSYLGHGLLCRESAAFLYKLNVFSTTFPVLLLKTCFLECQPQGGHLAAGLWASPIHANLPTVSPPSPEQTQGGSPLFLPTSVRTPDPCSQTLQGLGCEKKQALSSTVERGEH